MYAIFDCDNCFVSCERTLHPELRGVPVVVLSNNDGCIVARSPEAKRMGVKMGMPYFKMREMFPKDAIKVVSGHHDLYQEVTAGVMDIIRKATPDFYRYSIDEAFCRLDGMDRIDLKTWGEQLSQEILRETGMPVSIGIAPTKTLAKCADRFAKDYAGYNKCCLIDTEEKQRKALALFPIGEVWGIGRRMGAQLLYCGVRTAEQFVEKPRSWVRKEFHIGGERTWLELQGTDCIPTEHHDVKKSLSTTRTFAEMTDNEEVLRTAITDYAVQCAERLRQQHSVCATVTTVISTNRFRPDLPQYYGSHTTTLLTPDNSTQGIVRAAVESLHQCFRPGFLYKRGGVVVSDLCDASSIQTNFLDFDAERHAKLKRLSAAIDTINANNGRNTVRLGRLGEKKK